MDSRFRLVSLIVDAVLEDVTIGERRQTLHKMTNGFGLGGAYSTTLGRIREQKGNKRKLGMEALMWISRSKRPLRAEELCHALAVQVRTTDLDMDDVPSIRTLLSCTLGLVTVDEQASTVHLIHPTLQEHLTTSPGLFTTPLSMAEICLTYLNFQSICELSTTLDALPSIPPFLHYASCYWGFHAREEMTENARHLALQHLVRDANHISADILLHEPSVSFLSWWDLSQGRRPDLQGFTGLHCISYMGITEIAISMVDMRRWDMNGRDSNGATPLIWAAKYGNYTLAKLYLERGGADPTLSDKQGLTPLTHAAKAGQARVVELLLGQMDVNPDSPDRCGRTPLSHAAGSGHKGVVEILLKQVDVNSGSSDRYGKTPLSNAVGSRHKGAGALLGRVGVKPDSSDEYGRTPLSYAAGSGHEGVVEILLERPDVNHDSSDMCGRTPLSRAARSGHEGVVKLFLEQECVNPDSSDEYGRTPLSYAAGSGHEGVVKILLERENVDPDSSDRHGRTPLSHATRSGHDGVEILFQLVDVKPDSSAVYGQTPFSLATEPGRIGLAKLLSEPRPFGHRTSPESDVPQ